MNNKLIAALAGLLTLVVAVRGSEAPATPPPAAPDTVSKPATPAPAASTAAAVSTAAFNAKVQAVLAKINAKLQKGLRTEADFAAELAEFDAVIAAQKNDKSDAVALAEYYKDLLYLQYLGNPAKCLEGWKQLVVDYPGTNTSQEVAKKITQYEPQINSMIATAVGKQFQEFAVASGAVNGLDGKPLSVAQYRGKVVLIDFWATWCGPCLAEMPNVIAAYQKYHARGFDIIGVSLDHEDARAKLPQFLADNKMPWRQYFDGKFWDTELAVKYGIHSIPASYLLDANGKIIAVNPRGPALAPAIEAALAAASANKT